MRSPIPLSMHHHHMHLHNAAASELNIVELPPQSLTSTVAHLFVYFIPNLNTFPPHLASLLHADETARMNRYKQEHDRCRFLHAHAAKRLLLSTYTGIAPHKLSINMRQNEKPIVADASMHFNLSHSGNAVCVLLHKEALCGVDCEMVRPHFDFKFFAQKNYHPMECAQLDDPSINTHRTFFKFWSRKESWLKCTGMGIFSGLPQLNTVDGVQACAILDTAQHNLASDYYIQSFYTQEIYFSTCIQGRSIPIKTYNLASMLKY